GFYYRYYGGGVYGYYGSGFDYGDGVGDYSAVVGDGAVGHYGGDDAGGGGGEGQDGGEYELVNKNIKKLEIKNFNFFFTYQTVHFDGFVSDCLVTMLIAKCDGLLYAGELSP